MILKSKNLSELCDIQLGGTPYRKNPNFWDKEKLTNNVWLSISDLKHGEYVEDSSEYLSDEGKERVNVTPKGTLMLSFKLTIGRCSFAKIDLRTNEAIASLLNLSDEVDKKYLFYYFSFLNWDKVSGNDIKVKGKTLNKKKLENITIKYPNIIKQKLIVEKLDTCMELIDKAIQNVEQNIQNAEELFQSYLNEIFSQKDNDWETKKLGDISRLTYGITGKAYDSGDYRYVRITDIDDYGKLSYENKKYLKNQNECANFILKENDLVMARTGATFGKLLLYKDIEPSVYASYLIKIEFINDISNELYWFFTKTKIYWDQANSLSTGSAQPHFNGAALKEVLFSYPISKNKQKILIQKFYEQFSLSQSIKLNYQKEILALKELKQSILEKAFNGEL